MERPKLAVDIDETIVHFLPHFLEWYNHSTGAKFSANDFHSYRWWETLGCSKKGAYVLAEKYIGERVSLYEEDHFEGMSQIEFDPEAERALNILAKRFELYGITDRDPLLGIDTFETSTLFYSEKLEERGLDGLVLPADRIFDTMDEKGRRREKSAICRELGIDKIIDDNSDVAEECSARGIRVYMPEKPWNVYHPQNDLVFRGSWAEIVKKIRTI